MKNELLNLAVYCKRDGTQGKIVAVDDAAGTLSIETDGKVKAITNSTFKRWYSIIPQDNPEKILDSVDNASDAKSTENGSDKKPRNTTKAASGEAGIGVKLRDKFVAIVKEFSLDGVEIFVNNEKHTDVIKYKGKNVFECSYAKGRFNVLCHPDSLSPDNTRRVTKMCPKEWGWALRARFTFTSMDEAPLMKSVVSDGLYFRSKEKEGEANA